MAPKSHWGLEKQGMSVSFADLAESGRIYTVSDLTELVRRQLESRFPFVWVRGEVTDLSVSSSRHIYFSLKDGNALLQCVWFANRRVGGAGRTFDPLTGEVFDSPRQPLEDMLRNGLEIICAGGINVYAKSGRYQLVVEHAEACGHGLLSAAFERLKAKLAAAGYFAQERKRPLPANPQRIALITSPHGAAIHDFLTLASERGLSSTIRLFPVTVQGNGAAEKMAQAIVEANAQNWAQVVVLVRGGGSAEDLLEFNEEILVKAIYESRLPVLAGIGHEVDVFLSDMTADVRAATPSHAAQILWPRRRDLWQKLDELQISLDRAMNANLERLEAVCARNIRALGWLSPLSKMLRLEEKFARLRGRLFRTARVFLASRIHQIDKIAERLKKASGLRQKTTFELQKLMLRKRAAFAAMQTNISRTCQSLERMDSDRAALWAERLAAEKSRLEKLELMLESGNPALPLQKGYALLRGPGGIVRSTRECAPGDLLEAILADGSMQMEVRQISKIKDAH